MATERSLSDFMDAVMSPQSVGPESLGNRKQLAHIRSVIREPNIVGLGVALKVTQKKTLRDFALTFYVEKKMSLAQLRAAQAVPPLVATSSGTALATDVVEIGRFKPDAKIRHSPIEPGYSVGHFSGDTGTLGAIVTRGGKYFVLSNSHVLAKCGLAKKGDAIIYPGSDDGGKAKKDVIAKLSNFIKLKTRGTNSVDTAIAEIDADHVAHILAKIGGIGLVGQTIKAKAGMKVEKVGRTSGKTQGTVVSTKFRPLRLPYGGDVGDVSFGDQVLITKFTKPGDSGSLVVDVASRKAVGLHFASAKGGSVSAPIDRVLKEMGVKLVAREI
jgi:hypothetical protein